MGAIGKVVFQDKPQKVENVFFVGSILGDPEKDPVENLIGGF